jgi:hypothetical protein
MAGLPFGSNNFTLCGDFHQFPPVASEKMTLLYHLVNVTYNSIKERNDWKIYKPFQIIVVLEEQV